MSFIEANEEGSLTSKQEQLPASLNQASVRALVFLLQNENRTLEAVKYFNKGKVLSLYQVNIFGQVSTRQGQNTETIRPKMSIGPNK